MNRLLVLAGACAALAVALVATYQTPLPAGQVTTFIAPEPTAQSGVTMCRSNTGVSQQMTIDLRQMGVDLTGVFSLQFPAAIRYATGAYQGTTGADAEGTAGVTYYYITTADAKTVAQLDALSTSSVTKICSMTLGSNTPWVAHRFEPEFNRYLHILAQVGVTNFRGRVGAIVTVY